MCASWPHGPFGVRLTSRTLPGEAVSSEDSLGGFGTRQDAEGRLEVGQRVLGLRRHHAPCLFSSPSPSLDGHPDGDRSPWSPGGLQMHLGSLSGLILPGGCPRAVPLQGRGHTHFLPDIHAMQCSQSQ